MLAHARSKLSAVQRRYKTDFDRKVSFRPVVIAGDSLCVDRPSHASTEAETRDPRHLDRNTAEASNSLLPNSEGSYCVGLATDTVVRIVWDSLTTRVRIARDTKAPTVPRVAQSSAFTGDESRSKAAFPRADTGARTTVQDCMGASSSREKEGKYFIEKLVGQSHMPTRMQHRVRQSGYSPSENANRSTELALPPFAAW